MRWLTCILLLTTAAAASETITGRASIIDGDTLEIHGTRIRLWGIDAPESSQLCRDDDAKRFRCGAEAANQLDAFIGNRAVACEKVDRDRYGRMVATCRADGTDLADWLVRQGLALDWPRYSKGRYAAAQTEAEHDGRGIWGGSFVLPWRYRACVAAGGGIATCSDEAH